MHFTMNNDIYMLTAYDLCSADAARETQADALRYNTNAPNPSLLGCFESVPYVDATCSWVFEPFPKDTPRNIPASIAIHLVHFLECRAFSMILGSTSKHFISSWRLCTLSGRWHCFYHRIYTQSTLLSLRKQHDSYQVPSWTRTALMDHSRQDVRLTLPYESGCRFLVLLRTIPQKFAR